MEKRKGSDGLTQKPNVIYFSNLSPPDEFPKSRVWTIKPPWLMTAVLWVLRRLGFRVEDLRDPNHPVNKFGRVTVQGGQE